MNQTKFTQECINSLVEMDSVVAFAEAIAICLGNLKNSDGKFIGRINLSEDHSENFEYCYQIAEMLLNKKRNTIDPDLADYQQQAAQLWNDSCTSNRGKK